MTPAPTPAETFPLDPIVVLINIVDELSRDLFGKKNRATVIEIDTVFPGVARQDTDHRIAPIQATANLPGLLLGEGQVNVRTTHTFKAVTLNVGHIPATHSGKQLVRRFVRFPGIHLDRVAIKGANAAILDLVSCTVGPSQGLVHVFLFNRLAEPLIEGPNNIVQVTPAELVEFQIEFFRLVPEHVCQRTGQTLVERKFSFHHGGLYPTDRPSARIQALPSGTHDGLKGPLLALATGDNSRRTGV